MNCFLKITDLSKAFRQKAVFSNLNLEIERGEIYGLVGNNGSGKTTLLRVIAGMLKQDSGEVCFADKNVKTAFSSKIPLVPRYDRLRKFEGESAVHRLQL